MPFTFSGVLLHRTKDLTMDDQWVQKWLNSDTITIKIHGYTVEKICSKINHSGNDNCSIDDKSKNPSGWFFFYHFIWLRLNILGVCTVSPTNQAIQRPQLWLSEHRTHISLCSVIFSRLYNGFIEKDISPFSIFNCNRNQRCSKCVTKTCNTVFVCVPRHQVQHLIVLMFAFL